MMLNIGSFNFAKIMTLLGGKTRISRGNLLISVISLCVLTLFIISREPKLDAQTQAEQISASCRSDKDPEKCYGTAFAALTAQENADFSVATLKIVQDLDPQNTLGCHLIAHYIASAETRKHPDAWLDILNSENPYLCTGGFLHGVLEAHTGTDTSFRITGETFPLICNQFDASNYGRISCYHALGHLLLAQEEGSIEQAISICGAAENQTVQYHCLSGVFMENITRLNLESHGIAKRIPWDISHTAAMEKFCRTFTGNESRACWQELSYMFIAVSHTDPKGVYDLCRRAPNKDEADNCFIYGAGNMVVFRTFDPSLLSSVCEAYTGDHELFRRCTLQLIGSMTASSPKLVPRAKALCETTPEWFRISCLEWLEKRQHSIRAPQNR